MRAELQDQVATLPDPILLEVFSNALLSIAEEMGALLIRTAYSTNIKERHDASTAIFDAEGRLITQAEHIPDASRRDAERSQTYPQALPDR